MSLTSAELKKKIADILKDADLETTSAKKVRTQLEEDTGSDLSSRKEEIGKLIQEVMDETPDDDEEEGGEEEEGGDDGDAGDDQGEDEEGEDEDGEEESEEEEYSPKKKNGKLYLQCSLFFQHKRVFKDVLKDFEKAKTNKMSFELDTKM